jgi:hypothetical protein
MSTSDEPRVPRHLCYDGDPRFQPIASDESRNVPRFDMNDAASFIEPVAEITSDEPRETWTPNTDALNVLVQHLAMMGDVLPVLAPVLLAVLAEVARQGVVGHELEWITTDHPPLERVIHIAARHIREAMRLRTEGA